MLETEHAFFFESKERQDHAHRYGMWLFLASEVLLFSALFTMYFYYRAMHPEAYRVGIAENHRLLGTVNTVVLVCSSLSVALAVHFAALGRKRLAALLILVTLAFALGFLGIKTYEYIEHYHHHAWPGGGPEAVYEPGRTTFYNIYFLLTGTHGVHVVIGMAVLTWLFFRLLSKRPGGAIATEVVGLYWHLVDLIWLFLWPLFYLTGGQ